MSGEPTHPRTRQALITLVLGLGQTIAFASSYYLLGVMADPLSVDLDLSPAVLFGLMSLALAVSPLLSPQVGRWIDARGGKPVLLTSNLVFALALALLACASNFSILVPAMLALGVGMAIGTYGTPFAILVSLYGDGARRPITAVALLGGLGSAIGWPLTSHLIEIVGWRGACFVWALVHLLVCLPAVAMAIPKSPARPAHQRRARSAVAWDRRMVQLAVLFACAWFISSAMANHLPRLLTAVGLSVPKAAAVAGLVGVAAVLVRSAEFTVLRKAPPLVPTRIATLMHPLGAAALIAIGPGAAPLLALGQGAGNGMITVAKGVLPLSLYGPDDYAYRSALLSQPAQVLQIGGPSLYALALAESPRLALALSSALCLVMFAMTFGLQAASKPKKEHAAA